MLRPRPIPFQLGSSFSVAAARDLGVTEGRLRGSDLERPFTGTRLLRTPPDPSLHVFEQRRLRELELIHALAQRLTPGQFISHRSAAALWGVPLPSPAHPTLHLSALTPARAPRVNGTVGHRVDPERCTILRLEDIPVVSPATAWTMLGGDRLTLAELVAAGDHLVRVHRAGYGRPNPGTPPLTTLAELQAVVDLGRWKGAPLLRTALTLIREDSWSPQETYLRLTVVEAGLPEPELNLDVFDEYGSFLGCLDLAWERYKVGAEYHGLHHAATYAQDVERVAGLRHAGWDIIEVTNELRKRPAEAVRRIERALRDRGWKG